MSAALALTAFAMGLAGGPHCLGMCGAACGSLVAMPGRRERPRLLGFHAGRVAGYALAGAAAAATMQGLAWTTQHMAALRPLWTLLHGMALAWGLLLVIAARQPVWVDGWGRGAWRHIRPWTAHGGGLFASGALWALMPCGLLYSALLVAALSGGPLEGAAAMALFALGSGLWLALGPLLWRHLRTRLNALRQDWGTRIAGLLLSATAAWALWMDMAPRIAQWCA